MLISQKHNIIDDVSEALITFYENLETKFYIQETEIFASEVFAADGLLPIFLFDKQNLITKFCQNEISKKTAAFIYLKISSESLIDCKPIIYFNISNENDYLKLVKFLCGIIVLNPNLNKPGNIYLDEKYFDFQKKSSQLKIFFK